MQNWLAKLASCRQSQNIYAMCAKIESAEFSVATIQIKNVALLSWTVGSMPKEKFVSKAKSLICKPQTYCLLLACDETGWHSSFVWISHTALD